MKKFRSRLAVVLMLVMVFVTAFELVGVFAEDEVPGAEPVVTEEAAPAEEVTEPVADELVAPEAEVVSDEAQAEGEETYTITYAKEGNGTLSRESESVPVDGTVAPQGCKADPAGGNKFVGWYKEDGSLATQNAELTSTDIGTLTGNTTFTAKFEAIPAPQINGLTALASCESVYLRWTSPVVDGVTYTVTANGVAQPVTVINKGSYLECKVSGLDSKIDCFTGVYPSYTFVVTAQNESGTVTGSVTGAPVRTIAYKVKVKSSATLKSHNSIKGKVKVKAGQYIYAYGFGCGGKYLFKDAKGSLYFCNFTRTSKRSCVYSKNVNYTDEEATLFVNDAGLYSNNDYLVWVSTYTQHIYLFQGSAGNWTLNHPDMVSAECSTGKASSPSPTSAAAFGRQTIHKKIKTRHGIPYWSCYSDINAIHAKRSGWKMGKPASNGCVRNLKQNAQKIYNHAVKKKTKVYIN